MADTLSTKDVQEKTVKRDSEGALIPEKHEIDWGGETKVVETKPITTGLINELSAIDEEIANLKPKAVHEAMQTIYISPDPNEFTVEDVRDLEFQYLEALMKPLDEQMEENIGDVEGNR